MTQSSHRRRGPGKPFPKGKSGNPGGLPKTVREIRDLALSHSPAALSRLVTLVKSRDQHVAVRAAEAVLDRAGLKPFCHEPEKLDVTTHDAGDAIGRLSALVARRLAAGGAGSVPRKAEPGGS